jgi:hypothetical protein
MEYREIPQLLRAEIESLLNSEEPENITIGLLSAALYDPDPVWSESQCVQHFGHPDLGVRLAALKGIAHIARLRGSLDLGSLLPRLAELENDPSMGEQVADTLDDIRRYVRSQGQ